MILNLIPQRRDDTQPSVEVSGDTLILDGTPLDFSPLSEGSTLPDDAVDSPWIVGGVTRADGEVTLSLLLPHGPRAPQATRFPDPIVVTVDGPVDLPLYNEPEPEP